MYFPLPFSSVPPSINVIVAGDSSNDRRSAGAASREDEKKLQLPTEDRKKFIVTHSADILCIRNVNPIAQLTARITSRDQQHHVLSLMKFHVRFPRFFLPPLSLSFFVFFLFPFYFSLFSSSSLPCRLFVPRADQVMPRRAGPDMSYFRDVRRTGFNPKLTT